MIEYPSIISSSKAPRDYCIAFDKLDGSNFRAKWTKKNNFCVFGTRTQLINETTPFWNEAVLFFKENLAEKLNNKFHSDKNFRNEREIIVYGEFLGENSFAGRHIEDEKKEIVIFDILVGHKNRYFLSPTDFVKAFQDLVKIPNIIYSGNLNDEFIKKVRENKYNLKEGVICKGITRNGAYRGNIWMCKIKTLDYFEKLKKIYEKDWEKYWE